MVRGYPDRGQHGRVVHALGTRIVAGEWAPGETLPVEERLVAELGVGRSALREALKVLAGKGLVETRTRAGTIVSARDHWNLMDADVLGWQYEGTPSLRNLDDLAELRLVLEPSAARLAAARADEAAVRRIAGAFALMCATVGDPDAFIDSDLAFHAAIFAAAGNELLTHLNAKMGVALVAHRHVHTRDPNRYSASVPAHQAVLDAIGHHHVAKAERAMRELVEGARGDVLSYTGRDPRTGARAGDRMTGGGTS